MSIDILRARCPVVGGDASVEDPGFTVNVTESGSSGRQALQAVRAVTGLSLWHSKLLLDSTPVAVLEEAPLDTAILAARRLQEAGVPAAIRCTWCDRTVPRDGTLLAPEPCTSRYWPTAHCQANSLTSCDCTFCTTYGPTTPTR
ncbi:ribosomal protein L7/L12 [Streptacidiphilus fuscans]|uniref:Ribosomal protein L7/L12 n=1 Tax=Streptacidiphilus fuscans TaxID=2789292 RepID=A0A931FED8_9ACTN|nr:ribosomal protein L7/L12 [Streptacidiphilus fuscans]MBF9069095.1 ribosomal protein L7/L12 [Streptacidiphilus fuscans]